MCEFVDALNSVDLPNVCYLLKKALNFTFKVKKSVHDAYTIYFMHSSYTANKENRGYTYTQQRHCKTVSSTYYAQMTLLSLLKL